MSNRISFTPRDWSLLRLLSWTPATTALLMRASVAFEGERFPDERRLRERLQALAKAGFIRSWPCAAGGGGLQNYYKLTPLGYERLYGADVALPSRAYFAEVSPGLFDHSFRLAEAIVEIARACHARQVSIAGFHRENELALSVGNEQVQPDCFFRFLFGGRAFNVALEIDRSTESVDSYALSSIRRKLLIYHAYQEQVLAQWRNEGKRWERPRLRCLFLTRSVARAHHILTLAYRTNPNRSRRVVYAATHESFVTDADPLFAPLLLDHFGGWQALIDLHPTAEWRKAPVRLQPPLETPFGI